MGGSSDPKLKSQESRVKPTVVPIITAATASSGIPHFDTAPSMALVIPSVTSAVVGVLNALRIPRSGKCASPGSIPRRIRLHCAAVSF